MRPGYGAEIDAVHDAHADDVEPRAADLILDDAHRVLDRATAAEAQGDHQGALALLLAAIDHHPETEAAYARAGALYRKADRVHEAEMILLEGMCWFPANPHMVAEYAAIANDRQDWAKAARRYRLARERFPRDAWTHAHLATALRRAGRPLEAEQALLEGERQVPHDMHFPLEHAEIAAERHDWAEAVRRFAAARERFPDSWWACKRHADALQRTGDTAEAEAILLETQRRHPQEPAVFLDHAELAVARRDWTEALRRFELVRDRFPDMWWPVRRIVQTLREMDRFDEAERIVVEGMDLFPDDPAMFFDHADLKRRVGRFEEAIDGYRLIRERFPDNFWGHFLLAQTLTSVNRLQEAEAMLIETMRLFPEDPTSLIELAYLTSRIPAEARRLSLPTLGDMVSTAIERHGETVDLLGARAQLVRLEGDYSEYMRQLLHIAERHPDARDVRANIAVAREILLGRGEPVPDEEAPPAEAGAGVGDASDAPQDLVGLFESLGGSGPGGSTVMGCEFGFLQRALQIEPLSLLRWTGVTLPNIIRLFNNDFKDVGQFETTVITGVGDYFDWHVVDTVYDLHCDHTHLDRLTVPREEAQKMMCQRTSFLARKLREDLEDGDKIFVYRYSGRLEDQTEMLALARAVNAFGKNMLFFVCRADEHHAPLTVRQVHPGLVVGYMDWFNIDRVGFPVNVDGWMTLCRAAYRLWQNPDAAA